MSVMFSASRLMKAHEVREFCKAWVAEETFLKQQNDKAKEKYESYKTQKEKAAS